ncbi:MAG TPA: CAP domain-containing protein [Candidatus Peribacteraceae bacterium]|nr:CAP domain-containing protein [Candidatus Peribacteraceae bacterium]
MSWKRFTGITVSGLLASIALGSATVGSAAAQSPVQMNMPGFESFNLQSFFAQLNRTLATPNVNMSLFGSEITSSPSSSFQAPVQQVTHSSSSSVSSAPQQIVTAPSGSSSLDQDRQKVFQLVNQARAQAGLPAYTYNNILQNSAQAYAQKMNSENFFSHVAPDGQTLNDRMHASGYYQPDGRNYYYGENIAVGQTSPEQVMHDWMNSPEHKAAILSKTYKEIGIGRSGNYWVEHFGAIY